MATGPPSDDQLRAIYAWVDAIPLSRPKKNITRDFSDGCMLAEVIAAYFPELVDLHNYQPAHSIKQKVYNYETLNSRVLKKLGFSIPHQIIEDIAAGRPGAIEQVLNTLQYKMAKYRDRRQASNSPGRDSRVEEEQFAGGQDRFNRRMYNGHRQNDGNSTKSPRKNDNSLDKDEKIRQLEEYIEILHLKVAKLEELLSLKDSKFRRNREYA